MTKVVRFVYARSEPGLRYIFRRLLWFGYTSQISYASATEVRPAPRMSTVMMDHDWRRAPLSVAWPWDLAIVGPRRFHATETTEANHGAAKHLIVGVCCTAASIGSDQTERRRPRFRLIDRFWWPA